MNDVERRAFDKVSDLEELVSRLRLQIDQMKNWCNCKKYRECLFESAEKGLGFEKEICYGCSKWELDNKQEIKEDVL